MRTEPQKWSIAENLIHLCTTTAVFMPVVDRAIAEIRRHGFLSAGPFRLGWYGRVLVWYVQPPPAIRPSSAESVNAKTGGSSRAGAGSIPCLANRTATPYRRPERPRPHQAAILLALGKLHPDEPAGVFFGRQWALPTASVAGGKSAPKHPRWLHNSWRLLERSFVTTVAIASLRNPRRGCTGPGAESSS